MHNNEQPKSFWQSLSRQQKGGLGLLCFFILIVVLVWYIQLQRNLLTPFYGDLSSELIYENNDVSEDLDLTDEQIRDIYLKNNDSDEDGLSDWEEMNITLTSAFLEDSDGDGMNDKEELDAGTDPNCPEGQSCFINDMILEDNAEQDSQPSDLFPTMDTPDELLSEMPADMSLEDLEGLVGEQEGISLDETEILKQVFGDNPSPQIIRTILLQAGASEDELSQISDEELSQAYQNMINSGN